MNVVPIRRPSEPEGHDDAAQESTRLHWSDVLIQAPTTGEPISLNDVNDVCLLLNMADRVFIAGTGHSAAQAVTSFLRDTDVPVHPFDPTHEVPGLRRTDTVLVIAGPDDKHQLPCALWSPLRDRAVLLVLTSNSDSPMSQQADAVIHIPGKPTLTAFPDHPRTANAHFELLSLICADAIIRNLHERHRTHARSTVGL